eukprot:CAMPEP_0117472834 /NCGR_PEP_ID=MMETSP0784-20121206/8455_1 /TAXON_ID=39447 /ORGANISM="" /LENGTH=101 /DNA_ID=CAMNT_0005267005 /DNA_START=528 /DNA_END=833 /DNA_ORIENTATION=+
MPEWPIHAVRSRARVVLVTEISTSLAQKLLHVVLLVAEEVIIHDRPVLQSIGANVTRYPADNTAKRAQCACHYIDVRHDVMVHRDLREEIALHVDDEKSNT